ncbi:MAG: NPCBM/NEW2 domain-containing protein [Clostridiales bacterium]|jgi:beta-galactosidase|nr:NPCBM/NEW2 domain-containing protein [Clostridiales bacterium]
MKRFKKLASLFFSSVIAFSCVSFPDLFLSAAQQDPVTVADDGRKISFNSDWKFKLANKYNISDTSVVASARNYDDGAWDTVQLPHDWSIYLDYENSLPSGQTGLTPRPAQGSLAGGVGWYRKTFTVPSDFNGKSISIRFDGVQMISEMWINGQTTNNWKQYLGYVTFDYDITSYLNYTGSNTIAVKVQSSNSSARWYAGAGIYRNVWLIVTDKIHIPANGVYVTAPKDGLTPAYAQYAPITDPTAARLDISTKVSNDTGAASAVSLKSTVYNKAGDIVSVQTDGVSVPANGIITVSQTVTVPNPKLWSLDAPNLYWVRTEVLSGGSVIDTFDTRFGIRYLELNADAGLYLNGRFTKIYGVCEHSDLGPLGMETYQAAIDRRIRKLKAMGANAIRTAHNPVSPEYIEACDRLGILVMEEAFDQWTRAKNSEDYSHYFAKSTTDGTTDVFTVSTGSANITISNASLTSNAERDIKAMVDRDKNSPAVFTWSTGNEIDDTKYTYAPNLQTMLRGWIREIDTTRPVTGVPPWWDGPGTNFNNYMASMAAADIGGFNYATDYYTRGHADYPSLPLVGAETVSAFYTRGVYNISQYGSNARGSAAGGYSSEYPFDTNFDTANKSFVAHRDTSFIMGEFVWTGHDYLGEPTPMSYPAKSSFFGIIDTCGFEKDAFYLYRSMWSDVPTVRLLPQNWNWTQGTQVPIVVYTNARSVEVFLNGASIGTKTYNKATANPVYLEFGSVAFAPGELKAVAKDADGNIIATDTVYTAGSAQSVALSNDRAFIANDGRDLVYVEATIVDSAGIMVPDANNLITFNVTGGRIVAVGNGDPRDTARQRGVNTRNAFSGKALVIVAADKGGAVPVVVTATAAVTGGAIGSNTVTVGTVPPEEIGDGTGILDYEKPETTVGIGMQPALPESIRIIFDNGLIGVVSVGEWDLNGVDLNAAGDYIAYGTAGSVSGAVEAIIHVRNISAVDDIYVTTIAGVYPPLPKFVTIHYTDGQVGAAPVTWDPVEETLYAAIGSFDVQGRLGPSLTITAHVTVKQVVSVQDITVYTTAGNPPDMPSGVPVKFNDGSTETLAVDWTLARSDYAYPGTARVFGKLLGSGISAEAVVHVQSVVYLSDLGWVSASGTVVKDATVGGNALRARGVFGGPPAEYQKGLGTLADSEIVYDISGLGYDVFQAYVSLGLDDGGMTGRGAVAFEVYLDGALSFESGRMDRQNEAVLVRLDVTGISELKIVSKAVGTDGAQYDLADWCDAKFFADNIAVDTVTLPKQLYTNNLSQIPSLPDTALAAAPGAGTGSFKIEWPPLTAGMFGSAGVLPVYGRLLGTSNGVVLVKIITDYNSARTASDFAQKVGLWSETETFDFPGIAVDATANYTALTKVPRLIYSATANMIVENVQKYGFGYGTYPSASGNNNQIVFATPGLTYFQFLNVASTTAISNSGNFTFATSPDGAAWTTFTGFTKSGVLNSGGDDWPRRTYTSNAAIPAGVNFLRVTYPSGNSWQFNIAGAEFRGGADDSNYACDLAYFKLAGYDGVVNQDARTVSVAVPGNLDVTNITPEVFVSPGAAFSPTGPQDFTSPAAYTVSNGGASKTYTVTVSRGFLVSFNLYGGNIGGDTSDIAVLVSSGESAQAPAASPARSGYIFKGWTTDRASAAPMTPGSVAITRDTTFYAIWEKDAWIEVSVNADAGMKTWQGEKNSNYGGDAAMLVRQYTNTTTYGYFGESFNGSSTSNNTEGNIDFKTALVGFDIGQFKGLSVKSAQLVLWYAGYENSKDALGGNITFRAARADPDWIENQVTWRTRPTIYATPRADSNTITAGTAAGSTSQAVEFDVTSLYNSAPAGEDQLSFAVSVNNSSRDFILTSKEGSGANPERAPRLRVELDLPSDYMITYDLNGGSGSAPIQPALGSGKTFAASRALGLTGPAGKLFKEWNTKADGSGTSYNPGDVVTMSASNLTLYAIWVEARGIIVSYETFLDRVGIVIVRALEPAKAVLVIAAYGDNGELTSISRYLPDADGGQEQDIVTGFDYSGAASVRAFLWDDDFIPMAESKAVLQ